MKKLIFFLMVFILNIQIVNADDYASKENVDKKIDAEYYCYYNSSGLLDGNYNVIVGINKDKTNTYADTSGAYKGPINNWVSTDSNWDTDLNESLSAKKYFEQNGKCPEIAGIHNVTFKSALYLFNYEQENDIKDTFSLAPVLSKYYLVDTEKKEQDYNTKMSCKYNIEVKEDNFDKTPQKDLYFSINFNKDGEIINAINIGEKTSLSSEISTKYKYVSDVCPNIYVCHVLTMEPASILNSTNYKYRYELYFADYKTIDNRTDCIKVSCNNTNDSYCKPDSVDASVCPAFFPLYNELKLSYKENLKGNERRIYNENKDKIKSYCNNALQVLDADNPCSKLCLTLKDKIYELEKTTPKDGQCGFSNRLLVYVGNIIRIAKYIIPVIVIVLGILDFIKAIGADKEDEIKKAQGRFIKRLIAAALIFLIPFIIEFVLKIVGFGMYVDGCGVIDL